MSARRRMLAALGGLVLLAGCGSPPDATGGPDAGAPECAARADCAGGFVCVDGACTGCQLDNQCEGRELCHPLTQTCEYLPCWGGECAGHADCPLGAFCVQGLCLRPDETPAQDCPGVTPCADGAGCPGDQVCNPRTLVCEQPVACTRDEACEAGWYCDLATGACTPGCTEENAEALCPAGFFCAGGRCTECRDAEDCGAGLSCDLLRGRCVGSDTCFTDRDCARPLVCNGRTGQCTEAPPPCASNEDCAPEELCDLAAGRCVDAACPADAYEPNDQAVGAPELGEGLYTGLTLCDGEVDWYGLPLGAGDHVTLDLRLPTLTGAAYSLGLYTPDGTRPLEEADVQVDFTVPASGVYAVRVHTRDARGRYDLQILRSPGRPCADDGFEPNDHFTEARLLEQPGLWRGLVKCPGNPDWFEVPVPREGRRVRLGHDPALGDLDLHVWDADGVTPIASSAGTGAEEVLTVPVSGAGRVFVEVRGTDRTQNTYELSVEVLEP